MNRNKLMDNFIGNLSNAIVHEILKRAADDEALRSRYLKELTTSMKNALKYRDQINPVNSKLQKKDAEYIKDKIIKKVESKLLKRMDEGYKNVNLNLIEIVVEEFLKQSKII